MQKYNSQTQVELLLEDMTPEDWISWLFDIQNLLITYGHCESLSRKGSEDFSAKFATLKSFFQDLQLVEKNH